MAILEYYALEASLQGHEIALANYRRLARFGLKQFIYIGEGRFKAYLTRKVNQLLLPEGYVERALLALSRE